MTEPCYNFLAIEGKPEELSEFDQAFKGRETIWPLSEAEQARPEIARAQEELKIAEPDYCLAALVPVPQEVLDKGYDCDSGITHEEKSAALGDPEKWWDGSSWCISHWGTRLDVQDFDFAGLSAIEDGWTEYVFVTAWTPPEAWLLTVSKQFPGLLFRLRSEMHHEEMQRLVEYKAGELLKEKVAKL